MSLARSTGLRSLRLRPPRVLTHRRGLITVNFGGSDKGGSRGLLILSGAVGGATAVVVGGYAFYHWSGLKNAVQILRHPVEFLKERNQARKASVDVDELAQNETIDSTQILAALRQIAKFYVAPIPGSAVLVDLAFNQVEKVVDDHKEEARAVLKAALNDIREAIKTRGGESKEAAWDVLAILQDRLGQIQALASAAGQDKIRALFERIPDFQQHTSNRISGVHDSLLPLTQKGLEKGKNFLSGLSKRWSPSSPQEGSDPTVEPLRSDSQPKEPQATSSSR